MTSNQPSRAWRIKRAVLRWIDDQGNKGAGSPSPTPESVAAYANWDLEPISEDEIAAATEYLSEEGLIKGIGSWGGGVLRPKITSKGQLMVASGRELYEDPSSGTTYSSTVTVHGSSGVAVAANSNNVEQNVSVNTAERANALADAIAAARDSIADPEAQEAAAELEREIRQEAAAQAPDRTRLAVLAREAMQKVATAAGTALGSGVIDAALALASG